MNRTGLAVHRATRPLRRAALAFLLVGWATGAFAQEAKEEGSNFKAMAALFSEKCLKCHTVGKGDRVGPDLKGVSERRERDWLVKFIVRPSDFLDTDPIAQQMLTQFNGVRMDDLNLRTEQAEGLIDYIDQVSKGPVVEADLETVIPLVPTGRKVPGPDEGYGISYGALLPSLLLMAAAAALGRRGRTGLAGLVFALALSGIYCSTGGRRYHVLVGNQQGYEPVQPIAFSHRLHAGELEIACLYCHHGAEKGPVAGVPSVNVCMNCHQIVSRPLDPKRKSKDLEKLIQVWNARTSENARSIPWERVHNLPDFVTFDHRAHVQNNVQCQECHGPVETMDRVRQAADLSMGWCVECHRRSDRGAPTHWKRSGATLDCAACHQ